MKWKTTVVALVVVGLLAAYAGAEDDGPKTEAGKSATGLLKEHETLLAKKEGDAAAEAALELRALLQMKAWDDATRSELLDVLIDAYEHARVAERDGDADRWLASMQRLVDEAKDTRALRHKLGVARGFAHYELGEAGAFERARREFDVLRTIGTSAKATQKEVERWAVALYNEARFRRKAGQANAAARLQDALRTLAEGPRSTDDIVDSLLWALVDEHSAVRTADQPASADRILVEIRRRAQRGEGKVPHRALPSALVTALYHEGQERTAQEAAAWLDEIRTVARHAKATLRHRLELIIALANVIFDAHEARDGAGIAAMVVEARGLSRREDAKPNHRMEFLRALRNASLHYASKGRFDEATALRTEALALVELEGATADQKDQYGLLLKDSVRRMMDREKPAPIHAWINELRRFASADDAPRAPRKALLAAVLDGHIHAEFFQEDDKATHYLAELRAFAAEKEPLEGASWDVARALYNMRFYSRMHGNPERAQRALALLRAFVDGRQDDAGPRLELVQALEREYRRVSKSDPKAAQTLLQEIRRRATQAQARATERDELAYVIAREQAVCGDRGEFARCEKLVQELRAMALGDKTTPRQKTRFAAALVDSLWDVFNKQRPVDPRLLLGELRLLAAREPPNENVRRRLATGLRMAHAYGLSEGDERLATRPLLGELRLLTGRAESTEAQRDELARALEKSQSYAGDDEDYDRAARLLDELRRMARRGEATAVQRHMYAEALANAVWDAGVREKWDESSALLKELTREMLRPKVLGGVRNALARGLRIAYIDRMEADRTGSAGVLLSRLSKLALDESAKEGERDSYAQALATAVEYAIDGGDLKAALAHHAALTAVARRKETTGLQRDYLARSFDLQHEHAFERDEVKRAAGLEKELEALIAGSDPRRRQQDALARVLGRRHRKLGKAGFVTDAGIALLERVRTIAARDEASEEQRDQFALCLERVVLQLSASDQRDYAGICLEMLRKLVGRDGPSEEQRRAFASSLRAAYKAGATRHLDTLAALTRTEDATKGELLNYAQALVALADAARKASDDAQLAHARAEIKRLVKREPRNVLLQMYLRRILK